MWSRFVVVSVFAAWLAACGSSEPVGPPPAGPPAPDQAKVGPAGGRVTLLGGDLTIDFPASALTDTVTLEAQRLPNPPPNSKLVPGAVFEIGPAGLTFNRQADLTIRFDPTRVPGTTSADALQLYRIVNGTWRLVFNSDVSEASGTVSGDVWWTGVYAAVGTNVDRIVFSGAADGALYVGQSGQIDIELFDPENNRLSRTLAWTSSDPSVATVDASGSMTAHAPGTVTITVTVDDLSAATTMVALQPPTPRWVGVPPWTTHQGSADHTGFVDVVTNPLQYTTRFSAELAAGVPLNPVTFGPGAVFVTTEDRFGVQKAFGIDVQTGAQRWSRDYGGIHGVHPPAYGNGVVYFTTSGHGDSFLYGIDAATGAQRFASQYQNQWSRYLAPVVEGNRVYMAGGHYDGMYAFDAGTGSQVWYYRTQQFHDWTPAIRQGVAYANAGAEITAVRTSDGQQLYAIADPTFNWNGYSMNTAPVLGDRNDLLAIQNNRLLSFDLSGRSLGWEQVDRFSGSVTLADGVVYVINDGKLEARRQTDGSLLWSWTPPPLDSPERETREHPYRHGEPDLRGHADEDLCGRHGRAPSRVGLCGGRPAGALARGRAGHRHPGRRPRGD